MRKLLIIFLITIVLLAASEKKFNQSIDLMNQGRFDEAKKILTELIMEFPNEAVIYYNRGLVNLFTNDFENAEKDFTAAIAYGEATADAYNNRGLARSYQGNIEVSLDDFNIALKLDTNFAEAYVNRASNHLALQDLFKAEDDLKRAEKLQPDNPEIYLQKGRLYHTMLQYHIAVENFSKAIELGIENLDIYKSRGNSFYKLQNFGAAMQDYSKALEYEPNDPLSLNNRAMCYEQLGMDEKAMKDRIKLRELSEEKYADYKDIQLRYFADSDSLFALNLPSDWTFFERKNKDENRVDIIISKDSIDAENEPVSVGVTVGCITVMSDKFDVSNPSEILQSWIGGIEESSEEYYQYETKMKKSYSIRGFPAQLNLIRVQLTPSYMPFDLFQLGVAYGDNLFYAYFQAPTHEFSYYEPIFDKAIKTLQLNMPPYYKGEEEKIKEMEEMRKRLFEADEENDESPKEESKTD